MKTYIDFDGVIFDTEPILFKEWRKNPDRKKLGEEAKIKYIKLQNWKDILLASKEINNSIEILKQLDINNTAILTKVHSLGNEGLNKIKILRELGVKQEVIFVPYGLKKTDVVSAYQNILIDDSFFNLQDWELSGGKSIFFNKDNSDIDGWGQVNTKYQKVKSLEFLLKR